MLMSMVVAFTITPWLTYHVLKRHYRNGTPAHGPATGDELEVLKKTFLYRLFFPLMAPLLHSRAAAWRFLGVMAALMIGLPAWPRCAWCR